MVQTAHSRMNCGLIYLISEGVGPEKGSVSLTVRQLVDVAAKVDGMKNLIADYEI